MKYFIGTVSVAVGLHRYREFVGILADTERKALDWLEHEAANLYSGEGEKTPEGVYVYEDYAYTATVEGVREVSLTTFEEMQQDFLHVRGGVLKCELTDEQTSEQVRILARRIGQHLAKHDAKVSHSKLLHAVAASIGETDWQVLVHKKEGKSAPGPDTSTPWPDNGETQPFIPGEGYLWEVPVTVDSTLSATVKVRARDKQRAMELAREFAQQGNVVMTPDEENYRGVADHYVSDSEAVSMMDVDSSGSAPRLQLPAWGVQAGPFLVELTDLGDQDDELLWADLTVFDPSDEEPDTESCLSSVPRELSKDEQLEFCRKVAELLQRGAPRVDKVDRMALKSAFVNAVQAGADRWPEVEAKLRSSAS